MEDSFPVVREVIFSTGQELEHQESIKKSIHAIFVGREFSVKVTFDSQNKMILGITPPKDWTHSDAYVDGFINQALSSTWTILSPAVRVVTFAIALSKEEQVQLPRMLIAFAKAKQFSVQVTVNTGSKVTLHVKPLREGLNADSLIIQALTAALHPLQQGVDLLPKGQTWTISAADNLDTVLEEGEVANMSKSSSDPFGWRMSPALLIDSLLTFSDGLSQEDQQALIRFLTFNLIEDFTVTVTFISKAQMTVKIATSNDFLKKNLDVVILIEKALTGARDDRRLFGREKGTSFTIRPLRVVIAKFSCTFGTKSSTRMMLLLRPLVAERNLSIDFATWPNSIDESTDQMTLYITPLEGQPRFLLDVDTAIFDAIRVSISKSPWKETTFRLIESN